MESIDEAQTKEYVTAEELRDMTITKEERFERDRLNIMDSLMSSMVELATRNGVFDYSANLNPQFDAVLLTTVTKDLEEIGYRVIAESQKNETVGDFILLTVSWSNKDPQEVVNEVVEEAKQQ